MSPKMGPPFESFTSWFSRFALPFLPRFSDKIAVVLSGCGVYDGAEVHESAAALAAITRQGFQPVIFAPDKQQAHVVDHNSGQEQAGEKR